jgi:hypothetical protein
MTSTVGLNLDRYTFCTENGPGIMRPLHNGKAVTKSSLQQSRAFPPSILMFHSLLHHINIVIFSLVLPGKREHQPFTDKNNSNSTPHHQSNVNAGSQDISKESGREMGWRLYLVYTEIKSIKDRTSLTSHIVFSPFCCHVIAI